MHRTPRSLIKTPITALAIVSVAIASSFAPSVRADESASAATVLGTTALSAASAAISLNAFLRERGFKANDRAVLINAIEFEARAWQRALRFQSIPNRFVRNFAMTEIQRQAKRVASGEVEVVRVTLGSLGEKTPFMFFSDRANSAFIDGQLNAVQGGELNVTPASYNEALDIPLRNHVYPLDAGTKSALTHQIANSMQLNITQIQALGDYIDARHAILLIRQNVADRTPLPKSLASEIRLLAADQTLVFYSPRATALVESTSSAAQAAARSVSYHPIASIETLAPLLEGRPNVRVSVITHENFSELTGHAVKVAGVLEDQGSPARRNLRRLVGGGVIGAVLLGGVTVREAMSLYSKRQAQKHWVPAEVEIGKAQ